MPILIFVMTMLMIFALLAYGRLETFRNLAGVQGEFKHYVETRERQFINEQAPHRYDNIIVNEEDEWRVQDKRILASPTLSFYLFVNKEAREKRAAELEQHLIIAKNLLQFLYGEASFFIEASLKRQDLVDALLIDLMKSSEDLKVTENKDLSNVKFNDPVLDETFYHMLKGTPDVKFDAKTFKEIEGYPTLLDFITVKKKLNIRVFLASAPLLMAIFGDTSVVDQILRERQQLYNEVKAGRLEKQVASRQFKENFIEKRLPGINDTMLNFEVSKTKPATY